MNRRNNALGPLDSLYLAAGLLLVAAICVGILYRYVPVFEQEHRLRSEIYQLKERAAREREQVDDLRESVAALKTDPKEVERLARERLGFARTNETIFFFQPPAAVALPDSPR